MIWEVLEPSDIEARVRHIEARVRVGEGAHYTKSHYASRVRIRATYRRF